MFPQWQVLANLFWNYYVCLNSSLYLYKQTFDKTVFRRYLTLNYNKLWKQFNLLCGDFFFLKLFVWPYFLFVFQSTTLNRILWWMLACLGLYTWPRWGRHLPLHPSPALLSSTGQHREGASLPRTPPPLMANCSWNKWDEEGFLCILPTVL